MRDLKNSQRFNEGNFNLSQLRKYLIVVTSFKLLNVKWKLIFSFDCIHFFGAFNK